MGIFGSSKNNYITSEELDAILQPLLKRIEHLEKLVASHRPATEAKSTTMDNDKESANDSGSSNGSGSEQSNIVETEAAANPIPMPELNVVVAQGESNDEISARLTNEQRESTPQSIVYLSAPQPDGVFSEVSTSAHSGSIYQLTTSDGQNGRYIMLSTPDAIATAMISVSQFVKPACRIEGPTHQQPRNITTLEEGQATLIDGQWRVINKALVRFE